MKDELICPKCGSDNAVVRKRAGWGFILSFFLLGFMLPLSKRTRYCFDCEHEWKSKKEKIDIDN